MVTNKKSLLNQLKKLNPQSELPQSKKAKSENSESPLSALVLIRKKEKEKKALLACEKRILELDMEIKTSQVKTKVATAKRNLKKELAILENILYVNAIDALSITNSTNTAYPISYVLEMMHTKQWKSAPFQRVYVWTDKMASQLIADILLGLSTPVAIIGQVILDNGHTEQWIIDGLQRLLTIFYFFNGELVLKGLSGKVIVKGKTIELSKFNGVTYDNLRTVWQEKFKGSFVSTLTHQQISYEKAAKIFAAINNSKGVVVTQGENIMPFYGADFYLAIESIVNLDAWKKATLKMPDERKEPYYFLTMGLAYCLKNEGDKGKRADFITKQIFTLLDQSESKFNDTFALYMKVISIASQALDSLIICRPSPEINDDGDNMKVVSVNNGTKNADWFIHVITAVHDNVKAGKDTTRFIANKPKLIANLKGLFNNVAFCHQAIALKNKDSFNYVSSAVKSVIDTAFNKVLINESESAKQVETPKQLETESIDRKTIVDDSESDQPISCAVCEKLLAECTCTKEESKFTSETEITESTLDESDPEIDMGFDATNQEIAEEELAEKKWIECQCQESTLDDDDLELYDDLVIEFKSKNAGINLIRNSDDFSKLRESTANLVHFADFTGAIERIDSSFSKDEIIDAIVTWEFQKRN